MMLYIAGQSIYKRKSIHKIRLTIYSLMFITSSSNRNQHKQKTPDWVRELRQIIQDQVDSNLNLTEISKSLDINPSYLSREFSKHFNNLSFGEYIRKLRIEKAIDLISQKIILTH